MAPLLAEPAYSRVKPAERLTEIMFLLEAFHKYDIKNG